MGNMSSLLKAALMLMGAACVLLLAGAAPVGGVPAVYHSWPMLLLGAFAGLLSLWGGWRLSAGKRAQFVVGSISTFFVIAGVVTVWMYGCKAVEYMQMGGGGWFAALGSVCTMVVGGLFIIIFGYFMLRLMNPRLWLAAAHVCCALVVLGAFVDYCAEERAELAVTPGSAEPVTEVTTAAGNTLPLGFGLKVDSFAVSYYDDAQPAEHLAHVLITRQNDSYCPYLWSGKLWVPLPPGHYTVQGTKLEFGGRTFDLTQLRQYPQFTCPLLLESAPMPSGLAAAGTVKEYKAECTLETQHRGRPETRRETLKVNEPIACGDWRLYLMRYDYNPLSNTVRPVLLARRAPGRWFAMVGMVGIILSTACWSFWRRDPAQAVSPQPQDSPQV